MGGSGSTRWRDHPKAALVEDALELDVMGLEPALQHDQFDGELKMIDRRTGEVTNRFSFSLSSVSRDGSRRLVIDPGDNRRRQSIRLERAQRGWYRGWLFVCPADCGRRSRKLFADPRWLKFMCRRCGGLTYASAQQHDSRLDLARRDPVGFIQSRARAPRTIHSQLVTSFLALEALDPCRPGRSWGRKSTTPWSRMAAEMRADYERRWGFPPEDSGKVARGG